MLELADRADSNSAVREDVWVQVPPAVPAPLICQASPVDPDRCVDVSQLGSAYAYLFGLYLGDGILSEARRHVWKLRITLDSTYPGIMARAHSAIAEVGGRRPGSSQKVGCVEIHSHWKHWICCFPQHGRGPKHERPISLEGWQREIVEWYPAEFLTGLIHSDGCRCLNRVGTYAYPRYFIFSNRSSDIRTLFVMACGLVGIDARRAGDFQVSVARRDDVALLDTFIGPKT